MSLDGKINSVALVFPYKIIENKHVFQGFLLLLGEPLKPLTEPWDLWDFRKSKHLYMANRSISSSKRKSKKHQERIIKKAILEGDMNTKLWENLRHSSDAWLRGTQNRRCIDPTRPWDEVGQSVPDYGIPHENRPTGRRRWIESLQAWKACIFSLRLVDVLVELVLWWITIRSIWHTIASGTQLGTTHCQN